MVEEAKSYLFSLQERSLSIEVGFANERIPDLIRSDLTDLVAKCALGGLAVASNQDVLLELGFGRNLVVSHAYDPGYEYVISGMGYCEVQGEQIIVRNPQPQVTVSELLRAKPAMLMMGTAYINADGSVARVPNVQPLGAYTPDTMKHKALMTQKVQGIFKGHPDVHVPQIVLTGDYSDLAVSYLVYRRPEDVMGFADFLKHYPALLDQVIDKATFGVRMMHKNNLVHNQLHLNNWGVRMVKGKPQIWFFDFETCQDVSRHSTTPSQLLPNIMIAPITYAKEGDIIKWILDSTKVIANPGVRVNFMAGTIMRYANIDPTVADQIQGELGRSLWRIIDSDDQLQTLALHTIFSGIRTSRGGKKIKKTKRPKYR